MDYRLIKDSLNDIDNVAETFFKNRGIDDWENYKSSIRYDNCINDYTLLDNIREASKLFIQHIESGTRIHIIVDSDVDGICSAAMVYKYIRNYDSELNVTYSLHTGKQHGISEDIEIPEDCNLLIVPDAGSNDVEQCKNLNEKGIDIIIIDHHICDEKNDYAVIVNNQLCDYPNKEFCGAGIVQRFLECVDDELWDTYSNDLIDLCALGNISDVMDMRSIETRQYVEKGLNHIRSKAFKAFIDKQSYSINNVVSINNVQFYITPLINAMIRFGRQDEKELLFRAFIETDEEFDYKKRGSDETVKESIYDRAARLCSNAKSRQQKAVDKEVEMVENIICSQGLNNNKIIFADVTNVLSQTLTGLVAMKISDKHMKPCVLLRTDGKDYSMFGGSCRNFNDSPVEKLKELLLMTEAFEYVHGHDNAAGVYISKENVIKAIKRSNMLLKDVEFTKCYNVDFEVDYDDISVKFIKDIDDLKYYFGQGLKEPIIAITGLVLKKSDCQVMGKTDIKTWKMLDEELGIECVKFKCKFEEDKVLDWLAGWESKADNSPDTLTINLVGRVGFNSFSGIMTPQINIIDYEVVD